jgi:NHLM bacteriocin system ABC transporter peptidase/ATP-binding protein
MTTTATRPTDPPAPEPARRPRRQRRAKTPTVLQMEAVECGAASLAMILAYFGRWVPLEELRTSCGVSRDGSKASNMMRGARRYGLTAKGYRREPADLLTMQMPVIVHWNLNHFVVVEGFGKDKVYLNDPANGPRTESLDQFNKSFTGIVLTFERGPEFERGGRKPSIIPALRSRLRGSELGLLFVVLASLAIVVPNLAVPVFTQAFVDKFLVSSEKDIIVPLIIGMAITAVMRGALTYVQQAYLLRLETKISLSTSSAFFWHALHLPVEFYMQRYGGEIGARVAINDRVATLLSGELATNLLNVITIVFYAAVMLHYDVILTVVGVSIAALNFVALRFVSRRRIDGNRRLLQERAKLQSASIGGLQVIETLKATGGETDFFSRWSGFQAGVMNAEREMGLSSQLLTSVPPVLTQLNTLAILAIGGLRVIDGHLTIGMLVAFQSLMISFVTPVNGLVNLGSQLQEVEGDMNRLDDVLHYRRDPQLDDDDAQLANAQLGEPAVTPADISGQVEFRGLTFGYSPLDPPLIEDFNLTLRPGDRVALVGGSGSGKSTVAKLVAGLFQPWSGEVLFDGQPRSAIPRTILTNSIGMVDQDIFLFEGTIRDNLTMWDSTVPEANIVRAGMDAGIHEDISARQGGYDARVEELGRNFSGGQRQRLEIARALVGNPVVLILDEATSALDPITEKLIDDNLRRRGCTCLIIAHRLSTIRDADEIIVLERGKVVQRGTHSELSRRAGPYTDLISSEEVKSDAGRAKSILERLL